MDSLESKLDRLTPGQRREVDDFVDFLLQQSGSSPGSSVPVSRAPPLQAIAPPPFTVDDSFQQPETPPRSVPDLTRETGASVPPSVPAVPPSPIQEIIVGSEDLLTRDYMDYGRFDPSAREPSPADEAVRNVKEKLSRKNKEDRTNQLLDWVD
ncbi:MAG: hypothetical protein NTZ39_03970 [Methanoregula sp.]|nr:hypothetical protein [Methanoregula sp.]